ncbi:MAG: 7TM domain-containing protein [Candidatus Shapirobacteria bacterium]|jgi:hypothetical protein
MKKTALVVFMCLFLILGVVRVEAQVIKPTKVGSNLVKISPTATVMPTAVPTVISNITDVSNKTIDKREEVKWRVWNSLSFLISKAIERGVPANTIVLLLLLPLVATLVSVLHYFIGVSGYGIFMPTMMAVAFLATGIAGGLVLMAVILAITLLGNLAVKKLKLHFWPARSITLLFVGLGIFGGMMVVSYLKIFDVSKISIFPILFMILLTEDFVRTQLVKSKKEAVRLTVGTLILGVLGAMIMEMKWLQNTVLNYAEIVVILVIFINILVGNYSGIRLSEIKRFKGAIRKK